jgi:hypothetical protein
MRPRTEAKPQWVTTEVEAMQRDCDRRVRRILAHLLPCPKCGAMPQVDLGFLDAPYPPGHETIYCATVIEGPEIPMQTCGVHAIGAAAWNRRHLADGGA